MTLTPVAQKLAFEWSVPSTSPLLRLRRYERRKIFFQDAENRFGHRFGARFVRMHFIGEIGGAVDEWRMEIDDGDMSGGRGLKNGRHDFFGDDTIADSVVFEKRGHRLRG